MNNATQVMEDAYLLIEKGDLQQANTLLQPLTTSQKNNPDFWWLMLHATEDPSEGKQALQNLKEINPNYDGLQNILSLEEKRQDENKPSTLRRLIPLLLVLVVAIVLFGFLLTSGIGAPTNNVAQQPTATVGVDATPTQELSPIPFDSQSAVSLEDIFQGFEIPEDGIQNQDKVLSIAVCGTLGVGGGNIVRDIFVTLASNLNSIEAETQDVEVSIQNCTDTGEILRTLSVPVSILEDFALGQLTLQELQQAVQPIR